MTGPLPPSTARGDVDRILDHCLTEAGVEVAARFLDRFETAIQQIRDEPGIGSRRMASALDLPELRVWPVRGFPYLIFYLDRVTGPEIWRILYSARDVPAHLRE